VARVTGGEYFYAGTAEQLRSVYTSLGSKLQVQTRETEVSGLLALVAALVALAGGLLSVLWFGRIA
jgi:Ca-activated chloride channel family protein